ncbi:MAG: hypothetical protein V1826_01500 [bacterium]
MDETMRTSLLVKGGLFDNDRPTRAGADWIWQAGRDLGLEVGWRCSSYFECVIEPPSRPSRQLLITTGDGLIAPIEIPRSYLLRLAVTLKLLPKYVTEEVLRGIEEQRREWWEDKTNTVERPRLTSREFRVETQVDNLQISNRPILFVLFQGTAEELPPTDLTVVEKVERHIRSAIGLPRKS